MTTFLEVSRDLLANSRRSQFAGHDPFDGLNSPVFSRVAVAKNSLFGLAFLQLHKRSIINLRSVFGIRRQRNPKGVGLFILGLLEDYRRSRDERLLREAIELGNWLLTQRCPHANGDHACWGYHFDWKARAFFVPVGKPNIITTVYVSRALYALGAVSGQPHFQQVALDSAQFIVKSLSAQTDRGEFFAYIPGENTLVHNASLWGAAWVAFTAQKTDNHPMAELALRVARHSVAAQHADGAWVYGERHHHQFIDGFHTGYNLEALELLSTALATAEFNPAVDKGLAYYRSHFFLADGTVKYYHNTIYPLDMHSVSQAIITLLNVSGTPGDINLATKVLQRAILTMYLPDKQQFIYQKSRYFRNKINYIRWTQAWSYYAISLYNRFMQDSVDEKN